MLSIAWKRLGAVYEKMVQVDALARAVVAEQRTCDVVAPREPGTHTVNVGLRPGEVRPDPARGDVDSWAPRRRADALSAARDAQSHNTATSWPLRPRVGLLCRSVAQSRLSCISTGFVG